MVDAVERVRRALASGETSRDDAVAELRRRYAPRPQASHESLAEIFAPQAPPAPSEGRADGASADVYNHPVVRAALEAFSRPIERDKDKPPRPRPSDN